MTAIVVDGAHVLAERGFAVGTVRVEGGSIAAVAWNADERDALRGEGATVVDGRGCWLIPGLVSTHTHAHATLLRGTQSALPLELWSLYAIAYGAALDETAISVAMRLHAAECIRSGITGCVDHFPHVRHAAAALAAYEATGMRVLFAAFFHDISDYDLFAIDVPPALRAITNLAPLDVRAYEAAFADWVAVARAGSGRVVVALGPNAPQRCSPALWSLWRRLRDRHGVAVHTHTLETRAQARIARERWPAGMIAAMDDADLLHAGLSLAHAVHTTAAERELLARRDVAVAHNPLSNLTLGSGIMPLDAYLHAGVCVGIGTDGSNSGGRHDLFEAMRLALTLPRVIEPDPFRWPNAQRIIAMATANGNRIIGMGDRPTGIVPGAPADLVLVRRASSTNALLLDTIDGFITHAGRDAVEAVMIDGHWVLRDGELLAFDETQLLRDVADVQAQIAERSAPLIAAIERDLAPMATQFAPWLATF